MSAFLDRLLTDVNKSKKLHKIGRHAEIYFNKHRNDALKPIIWKALVDHA
jgi:hypothetical protein